jgi:hypothetical protein
MICPACQSVRTVELVRPPLRRTDCCCKDCGHRWEVPDETYADALQQGWTAQGILEPPKPPPPRLRRVV